jgi:hypothetical protein
MKTALLWVITQRVVVISYRRFGTTCRSHLHGSRILDPWRWEEGNNPEERSSYWNIVRAFLSLCWGQSRVVKWPGHWLLPCFELKRGVTSIPYIHPHSRMLRPWDSIMLYKLQCMQYGMVWSNYRPAGFEVFRGLESIPVFWDVIPCHWVSVSGRFEGKCRLHLPGFCGPRRIPRGTLQRL